MKRDPVTAADRDGYHDAHRLGFWLLVGKRPGPYVPREPVFLPNANQQLDIDARAAARAAIEAEQRAAILAAQPPKPKPPTERACHTRLRAVVAPRPDLPPPLRQHQKVYPARSCALCHATYRTRSPSQTACSQTCAGILRAREQAAARLPPGAPRGTSRFKQALAATRARVSILATEGQQARRLCESDSPTIAPASVSHKDAGSASPDASPSAPPAQPAAASAD